MDAPFDDRPMPLTRKLAVGLALWAIVLVAVYWYYWYYASAYYFPGAYEDAFTAMFYSLAGGVVLLVAIAISHVFLRRR